MINKVIVCKWFTRLTWTQSFFVFTITNITGLHKSQRSVSKRRWSQLHKGKRLIIPCSHVHAVWGCGCWMIGLWVNFPDIKVAAGSTELNQDLCLYSVWPPYFAQKSFNRIHDLLQQPFSSSLSLTPFNRAQTVVSCVSDTDYSGVSFNHVAWKENVWLKAMHSSSGSQVYVSTYIQSNSLCFNDVRLRRLPQTHMVSPIFHRRAMFLSFQREVWPERETLPYFDSESGFLWQIRHQLVWGRKREVEQRKWRRRTSRVHPQLLVLLV